MKQILISGDVTKDFERLGVKIRTAYEGVAFSVYTVTDEEFELMCNESDTERIWQNCGWRYSEKSNQEEPTIIVQIKGKPLKTWGWEGSYANLLEYIEQELGACTFKNISALTSHLAKANNITLGELFSIYQG